MYIKKKLDILLKNVLIPFGPEDYYKSIILNLELSADDLYKISTIENDVSRELDYTFIPSLKNKLLRTKIRKSKNGYCIVKIKDKTIFETIGMKAHILIELDGLWVYGDTFGTQFYVKEILPI